eukprot:2605988-Prymnesium_polylepis.1
MIPAKHEPSRTHFKVGRQPIELLSGCLELLWASQGHCAKAPVELFGRRCQHGGYRPAEDSPHQWVARTIGQHKVLDLPVDASRHCIIVRENRSWRPAQGLARHRIRVCIHTTLEPRD